MAATDGNLPVVFAGEEFTVRVILADMVAWERYARQHRIPLNEKALDFPVNEKTTYLIYAACRREKRIAPTVTFDEFLPDLTLDVEQIQALAEGDGSADDPTSGPVAHTIA